MTTGVKNIPCPKCSVAFPAVMPAAGKTENATCPHCGASVVFTARKRSKVVKKRVVLPCPRCGLVGSPSLLKAHQVGIRCVTGWFAKQWPALMVAPAHAGLKRTKYGGIRPPWPEDEPGGRAQPLPVQVGVAEDGTPITALRFAPKWAYAVAWSCPPGLHETVVQRVLADPTYGPALDTLYATVAKKTGGADASRALLKFVETPDERAVRLGRERAEKNEREARSELRSLEREFDKVEKALKEARQRVAYYDRKKDNSDASDDQQAD